jgi:hypothetical protein
MNTTHFRTFRESRLGRWGLVACGIALVLLGTGDRRVFSALDPESGIDPLDVLTTKTRPNVYFVLDSSASMAEFTDSTLGGANTTEDEANSKMAQAKSVMRQLVADNQGIANFALARYKGSATTLPTSSRFIYATDDIDFPTITTSTLLLDLKQFSTAAFTIPINEAGTNRTSGTIAAGNFNTGWDLAAAMQTALNATPGKQNTYKVTFVDAPGGSDARFSVSATNASPVLFTIRGSAMTATVRATTGFTADISSSIPTVTPPNNASATTINMGSTTDPFTFTENGTTRNATFPSGNHTTSAAIATAFQNALNAAPSKTNTYTVTFTSSKFVVTATGGGQVPFVIAGGSFLTSPNLRGVLGYNNANAASTTGSTQVTAQSEPSGAEMKQTLTRTNSMNTSGKGRTGVSNTEVDWIGAEKFFLDMTLRVSSADNTPCAIVPAATPSLNSAAITVQPMTSCDPTASPTTTGTAMTFKFSGTNWAGTITGNCGGLDPLVNMGLCTDNFQITAIGPYLAPTIAIENGAIAGYSQNFLGTPTLTTPDGTMPQQLGIRQNAATPIAESLLGMFKEYNTLWHSTIAAQPVGRRQRNFVIFLTDGDDTCEATGSAAPASSTTSNLTSHALRAAYVAQQLYTGVGVAAGTTTRTNSTAAWKTPWPPPTGARDPESKVTTFVVVFGAGAQVTNANYIAWGGTGMVRTSLTGSSYGTQWSSASPPNAGDRAACTTCRDAFTASTAGELSTALQNAINLTQEGEFSDQQSVTESVYEYVALAPPGPPPVPPAPTPAPQDPMNSTSRYSRTVPVILQSTFVMPNFEGHLTAFRNDGGGGALELWDAGQKLKDRVVNGVTGTDGMGTNEYTFAQLFGNATPTTVRTSTARIKRRIFTTRSNGKLSVGEYNPQTLVDQSTSLAGSSGTIERVPLWPPSVAVSPADAANSPGILDAALGLSAAADVAAVQVLVPDACKGATAGSCTGGTAATRLAKARREAREIMLAWLAGAQPRRDSVDAGKPKRVSNEIVYVARSWVMVESSLAAPAVVAPPPQAESTDFKRDEYLLYRDGPRKGSGSGTDPCPPSTALSNTSCFSVNGFSSGFGLRNPDLDGSTVNGTFTAQANTDLKPVMSVVYHATNAGLHAFRAGPCPSNSIYSTIGGAMTLGCENGTVETGGEELWAFVPFDQLEKLNDIMLLQRNDASKVYMLAAPVRFSDIWIDGGWSRSAGVSPTPFKSISGSGVWRTVALFGRGAGGKFVTGMDITVSGNVGAHTLDTTLPVVMWNRGNPDPDSAYLAMGQTWSVPAVGRVVAADYSNNDHVLFMGSGYSAVVGEGSTFFVISPRNGDILRSFPIAQGSSTAANPPFRNRLVASPSVHSELTDGRSPLDRVFLGNPAGALTKAVFFPDLHGRIWKYNPETPATSPVEFANARAADSADQPFANSLALLRFHPTPVSSPAPDDPPVHVFAESGNDNRVALRTASPFFKMYGYRDEGAYPVAPYLSREFPAKYRGQVQPATAFVGDLPVVFFAGNRFSTDTAGCISQFDAVLFALNAATNTAAFDLRNDPIVGDDYVEIANQRISAIRVAGSRLVVDTGLRANVAPPPPEAPTTGQTSTVGESTATVSTGADPTNLAHAGFRTTTVPYRLGTSTCRANQ